MSKANLKVIKPFVSKVLAAYPGSKIILFGSRAKGTHRRDSDYDILVISKLFDKVQFDKRAPALYRLKRDIPAAMDIICATPAETKTRKISVIDEALREGIEISA
ncbi:nucleotidyltransferase domain-containing protein [Candidatus Woesearchaeota archaeon]|nr:nucleotidyltransferase domain-containing protein [Candidatus Woesearchaeota archaeon]